MSNRVPIHTRRNPVVDENDPYIDDESLHDNSVCRQCGNVYMQGRWYTKDQLPEHKMPPKEEMIEMLCPACHKQQDRMPGGVLRLSGNFVWDHKDEIMNLVYNETNKAQGFNPLERIMNVETIDNKVIEITTTNEKLAQRIGKALNKAYRGHIEYKWSEDTKLARINWNRQD